MANLGSTLTISIAGSGTGTVSSANIPIYSSPVIVANPISCSGPCLPYTLQNSVENPFGPWSFTLIATPNPGSVFAGWIATPNGPTLITPATSATASQVFTFENSDIPYTITAQFDALPCTTMSLDPPTFPNGCINVLYFASVTGVGGTAPYTYPVFGSLPPGLLSSTIVVPGSFTVTGTPTTAGTYNFIINVTDANQCITEVPVSITIEECGVCYELISCTGSHTNLLVTNDLALYVGLVIQILGECFTVEETQSCVGAITLVDPVITSFPDCCSCNPPVCYELRDCTLLTPAIQTNTDLSLYVGKTVKVCEFTASPVIIIDGLTANCTGLNQKGFITQITGTTSGFYYESSSGLTKPYTNPLLLTLNLSDYICVNPASPFDVISSQTSNFDIQFLIGTTPITTIVTVNSFMPIPTLQFLINQHILYPNTTITVNTFDTFNKLSVTVIIKGTVSEETLDITVKALTTPTSPTTITVTTDLSGGCICYTVFDLGPNCSCGSLFTGVIAETLLDCECCLPKDIACDVPFVPSIPEINKLYYRIEESECDIEATKTYANAMYDIFKTEAYGMESCCPRNFDKI